MASAPSGITVSLKNKKQQFNLYVYPEPLIIQDVQWTYGGKSTGQPGYLPADCDIVYNNLTATPISQKPPKPYKSVPDDELFTGAWTTWWDSQQNKWIMASIGDNAAVDPYVDQSESPEQIMTAYRLQQLRNRQINMYEPVSPPGWFIENVTGYINFPLPSQVDDKNNVLLPQAWAWEIILVTPFMEDGLVNWGAQDDTWEYGFTWEYYDRTSNPQFKHTTFAPPRGILYRNSRFDING